MHCPFQLHPFPYFFVFSSVGEDEDFSHQHGSCRSDILLDLLVECLLSLSFFLWTIDNALLLVISSRLSSFCKSIESHLTFHTQICLIITSPYHTFHFAISSLSAIFHLCLFFRVHTLVDISALVACQETCQFRRWEKSLLCFRLLESRLSCYELSNQSSSVCWKRKEKEVWNEMLWKLNPDSTACDVKWKTIMSHQVKSISPDWTVVTITEGKPTQITSCNWSSFTFYLDVPTRSRSTLSRDWSGKLCLRQGKKAFQWNKD